MQLSIPPKEVNQKRKLFYKVDCKVKNTNNESLETSELVFEVKANRKLLSPNVYKINYGSDATHTSRIKFILDETELAKDSILVIAELRSFGTNIILAKDSLWLATKPPPKIYFKPLLREIFVEANKVVLPLIISNPNNQPMEAIISLYNPPDFVKKGGGTIKINIPSNQDTLINFPVNLSKNDLFPKNSVLYLSIDSPKNKKYGLAHYQLFQLKSKSRFLPLGAHHNFYESLEVDFYTGGFSPHFSVDYTGAGQWQDKEMEFSIRPVYLFNRNQLSFYNTFYSLSNGEYEWKVGNYQFEDELLLNGKIAAFERKLTDGAIGLSVVNSQQDILSFINNRGAASKNAIRLHSQKRLKSGWNWQNVVTNQSSEFSNISLAETTFQKENLVRGITFRLAAGFNKIKTQKNEGGIAVKMNYYNNLGSWKITSKNYLASKGFPGLYGGQVHILQKINYNGWEKWTTTLSANLNNYDKTTRFFPSFSSSRLTDWHQLDWQFRKKINANMQFWFSPNLTWQKLIQKIGNQTNREFASRSNRLKIGVKQEVRKFVFDATIDAGVYQSFEEQIAKGNRFSFRSSSNFNYNQTSLVLFYNHGPYYLFEEIQLRDFLDKQAYFSGMIKQKINLFGNRAKVQMSAQYIYNQTRQNWNQNFRVRCSSNFLRNWTLTTEVNVLKSGNYINTIFNVGLRKKIKRYRDFSKDKKLKIVAFHDENRNAKKDSKETALSNLIVKVGKETMVSNKKGEIILKDLPPEDYELTIADPERKYAEVKRILTLKDQQTYTIGLTHSFVIYGKINLTKERFSDDRVRSGGVKVELLGLEGKKYETFTAVDGSYSFSVPRGSYYVQISNAFKGNQFKIADNFQKATYQESKNEQEINFEVTVKSRGMKIQNFNKKRN